MNRKEALLNIIKHKTKCEENCSDMPCFECPIADYSIQKAHKIAIELYINKDIPMTDKVKLLEIIKNKGICDFMDCDNCPVKQAAGDNLCTFDKELTYKTALDIYITDYGKDDADLIEALI